MTPDRYIIFSYVLFWILRIYGCVRRGRQPLLRGKEWFFSVRVPDGFYEGDGRTILQRYMHRMLLPFVIDVPFAIAIFLSGKIWMLNLLIIGLCVVIHVNHVFSVDRAERQARAIAAPQEPIAVALSLETRRLRDYTSWPIEAMIAILDVGIFAVLIRYYVTTPGANLWRLLGTPLFLLYLQVGMLWIKWIIVTWRTPAPRDEADAYMSAAERMRRFRIQFCDFGRLSFAVTLVLTPIRLSVTHATLDRIISGWLVAWLLIAIVMTIWGEIQRKRLSFPRIRVPDFQRTGAVARPLICYEPSAPQLMLRSANGLSINLASRIAQTGFLYAAGLIALFAALPPRPH